MATNIVNVGYASTNYYVLGPDDARLLVDCGMPGTLPRLLANLRRMDIPLQTIRSLLVTHYHPDHAGLAQELKCLGVQLIVLEPQRAALPRLKIYVKLDQGYIELSPDDNLELRLEESRAFLERCGIAGEVVATPGHSDDSVSLVLDDGVAFTGDLPPLEFAREEARATVAQSWERLRARGVRRVYPGHGPPRWLPLEGAPAP